MKDPEQDDWDDDEYNYYPEYNYEPQKFKFDWSSWEKWLKDAIDDIVKEGDNSWVVKPKKDSKQTAQHLMYLGNNNYKEPIWKHKYFVSDKLDTEWKNHIMEHAAHFLKQPHYYKGLFDNMN